MLPLIPIAMGLAQYAPGIIKLLTGSDKAQDVAQAVVGVAQAVTGSSTPEGALAAVQLDPEKALAFQEAMAKRQADMELAYMADMQNARARDVEIVKTSGRNTRANILAGGAGFVVLVCLAVVVWQSGMDDYVKATISLILGRAFGWLDQIMGFEFGLTRESAKKDDTIKNLSK